MTDGDTIEPEDDADDPAPPAPPVGFAGQIPAPPTGFGGSVPVDAPPPPSAAPAATPAAPPTGFGGGAPLPPAEPAPLPPGTYLPPAAAAPPPAPAAYVPPAVEVGAEPGGLPVGFTGGAAATAPAAYGDTPASRPADPTGAEAERVRKPQKHRMGQTRNPWSVWLLTLVTLGFYGLVWWFKINQECGKFDVRIQVKPGRAAFALLIPIAGIVTVVKTGTRIADAQHIAGLPKTCSGGRGFLMALLLGLHVVYYQTELNKVWTAYGNPPPGTFA